MMESVLQLGLEVLIVKQTPVKEQAQSQHSSRECSSKLHQGIRGLACQRKAALYFEDLGAIQASSFIYFVLSTDSKTTTW